MRNRRMWLFEILGKAIKYLKKNEEKATSYPAALVWRESLFSFEKKQKKIAFFILICLKKNLKFSRDKVPIVNE